MKAIFICLFSLVLLSSFGRSNPNDTLRGLMSVKKLQKATDWFSNEYKNYQPEVSDYYKLRIKEAYKGKKIYIIMGTWCSDSRREVPRFYKILHYCGLNAKQVKMVAVDKSKLSGKPEFDQLETVFVPTFVFMDENGKELGRIIESPSKNLEYDIMNILKLGFWEAK